MDADLEYGVSQRCATFDNSQLSKNDNFQVVHVEVWALRG